MLDEIFKPECLYSDLELNLTSMAFVCLDQALDAVLEKTWKRISATLDCESSAQRVQAFTLLIWVKKKRTRKWDPVHIYLKTGQKVLIGLTGDTFFFFLFNYPYMLLFQ